MRLRHIEVFHAVYTCGSITAAARHLNVSQPSVSKVLSHAEIQLGYRLFDRVKGKLIPTREAERLIGSVSAVYQRIDELRELATNLGTENSDRIRIAVTPAFGIDLVPSAVASFSELSPSTRFTVETLHFHQVVRALNQSRINIGLVFQPSREPGIAARTLTEAEFVAVMRSEDAQGVTTPVALQNLSQRHFISLSDRGPLGQLLAGEMENNGLSMNSSVRAETYQMAMSMVAHGGGATIIDEITARSSQYQDLSVLPLDPPLKFSVSLVYKDDVPLSRTALKFVKHLEGHIHQYLDRSS